VLLATYVDVPRNRCHMNARYTEKNFNLWYDQEYFLGVKVAGA
jgi:hypothetical protein